VETTRKDALKRKVEAGREKKKKKKKNLSKDN